MFSDDAIISMFTLHCQNSIKLTTHNYLNGLRETYGEGLAEPEV